MMDTQEIVKARAFQLGIEMASFAALRTHRMYLVPFLEFVNAIWDQIDRPVQYRIFGEIVFGQHGLSSDNWSPTHRKALADFAKAAYSSMPKELQIFLPIVYNGNLPWGETK